MTLCRIVINMSRVALDNGSASTTTMLCLGVIVLFIYTNVYCCHVTDIRFYSPCTYAPHVSCASNDAARKKPTDSVLCLCS